MTVIELFGWSRNSGTTLYLYLSFNYSWKVYETVKTQ
jgi:hypothetical protein